MMSDAPLGVAGSGGSVAQTATMEIASSPARRVTRRKTPMCHPPRRGAWGARTGPTPCFSVCRSDRKGLRASRSGLRAPRSGPIGV